MRNGDFIFMTTSKIEQATRFAQTSAAFVRNAVQRRINKENYIQNGSTSDLGTSLAFFEFPNLLIL